MNNFPNSNSSSYSNGNTRSLPSDKSEESENLLPIASAMTAAAAVTKALTPTKPSPKLAVSLSLSHQSIGRKRTHEDTGSGIDNNDVSGDNKENEKPKAAAEEERIDPLGVVKGIPGAFGPYVVLGNAKTKEQLDEKNTRGLLFVNTLVVKGLLCFTLTEEMCRGTAKDFLEEVASMNLEIGLFFLAFPVRKCVSSGYWLELGLNRLNAMTTVDFKTFFKVINSFGHKVKKAWLVQFLEGGWHGYHADKSFAGTHRWIISLSCHGKRFGFKMNGIEVGLRLQHGSVIVLNETTSGLQNNAIKHAGIGDVQGSVSIVIETSV